MTTPQPHPAAPSEQSRDLLARLALEEAALADAAAVLEELNRCLRSADRDGLRAAQGPHARIARRLEELQQTRAALAESLRSITPPPPQPDELAAAVGRVRALARRVDAINRRNAMLARICLNVVQHGLSALCGTPAPARYGPRGQPAPCPEARLLEARG
jgi:hypothetical protein